MMQTALSILDPIMLAGGTMRVLLEHSLRCAWWLPGVLSVRQLDMPFEDELAGLPLGLTIQRVARYAQGGSSGETIASKEGSAIERQIHAFARQRAAANALVFRMPDLVAFVARRNPMPWRTRPAASCAG